MYVCMYVYLCARHVCLQKNSCIYLCVSACIQVYVYICTCIYTCVYVYSLPAPSQCIFVVCSQVLQQMAPGTLAVGHAVRVSVRKAQVECAYMYSCMYICIRI